MESAGSGPSVPYPGPPRAFARYLRGHGGMVGLTRSAMMFLAPLPSLGHLVPHSEQR